MEVEGSLSQAQTAHIKGGVLSIDQSEALALPGSAVLTADSVQADINEPSEGLGYHRWRSVRLRSPRVGGAVCLLAADTPEILDGPKSW